MDNKPIPIYSDTIGKRKKREIETPVQSEIRRRETRLARDRERKRQKKMRLALENNDEHRNNQEELHSDNSVNIQQLSESDHLLLQKFRTEINKLEQKLYPVCNERFTSIILVKGMCHRCYSDKNDPKKFSAENNMDPGDVPEELSCLSEIEEMLIAQVFPIV
ncbi:hypothetical protein C1645_842546 [Glomus cerebriforme]|uniref:DUF6570 domain-containing protein n=1 Tax=Glomus cerebriforme TaxID=658196 RepID=A0A397RWJ3_9GLOM|nr:hypothetical protein C1645_842546 [Glomus cerebriforme]